jgi:hypothetical protein
MGVKNVSRRLRAVIKLASVLGVLVWHCCNAAPAAAQPGTAKCGVFFDKSGASGAPPGMLVMAEVGHEVVAAQDCVTTGNVSMACEHWRHALKALEGADPAVAADLGAGIRNLMQAHNCS